MAHSEVASKSTTVSFQYTPSTVYPEVYSTGYPEFKRALDVIGGITGLSLLIVLYPIVGLLIRLETQGPILVKLDRVSRGKTIKLYKFRSMISGAHAKKPLLSPFNERKDGPFFKMKNDPRLTRIGKVIRKFRIDEVPQFINVLRGDLSLVGPRPHEPEEIAHYPEQYSFLPRAKAGITGLSQVSGASLLSFEKELELDAHYVTHVSLLMDLKLIAKTLAIFLFDPSAV
jgi:lipopolysaccharide/colanic/teichoic acid biosynthesis glycosyltransferase